MPMSPRLLRPRASNFDPDAATYMNAVAVADGQQLEPAVKQAINNFVKGCKQDGIWSALKASCILMGARTLAGALTPLVGSAPTNVNNNFVSNDYNRKTGLGGNGTNKHLNTNRNVNTDPQNSYHQAVYVTTIHEASAAYMGAGSAETGSSQISTSGLDAVFRNRSSGAGTGTNFNAVGLIGMARGSSASFVGRGGGAQQTFTSASETPFSGSVLVFARNSGTNTAGLFSSGRIAFYSVGENLALSLLDTRISALYTAIGAAIP